jgi:hypothetical protein
MTLRSTLIAAAAMLLVPAALPAAVDLAPPSALAQDTSADVKTILADATPASELDDKVLRERIKTLRSAIKDGTLKGSERKEAKTKAKSYRSEVKSRKGGKSKDKDKTKKAETTTTAAVVSETDCEDLWDDASVDDDDETLTGEEAKPFVEPLKTAGMASSAADTGSGPVIKEPDFMDACKKGTFKEVKLAE